MRAANHTDTKILDRCPGATIRSEIVSGRHALTVTWRGRRALLAGVTDADFARLFSDLGA